jgi:hypothetical protein
MTSHRAVGRIVFATQLATFCDVDLKTIHNWANRGKIPCWRTPGRHLRFRRLDIVDFLRAYGFGLPEVLLEARPDVVVIDENPEVLAWTRRALSRRFDLVTFDSVVEGLLVLAASDPEVLVLGDVSPLEAGAIVARLGASEATKHVRVVTLGVQAKGAAAWASTNDVAGLRGAMERVTGVE